MLVLDSLVIDLVYGEGAKLTQETLLHALGGEEVAKGRMILDADLDLPEYEAEVSPTVPLRRRGERRLLVVDASGPLRKSPRTEPVVAKDLRAEKGRLVALVEETGARWGRLGALGTWGDAAVVARSARDLRGLALLSWALDPTVDIDGRKRAGQLGQREFEMKIAAYDKRLDELDDETLLARVPPANLERKQTAAGELIVIDCLAGPSLTAEVVTGSWDVRTSAALEKRLAATELFSRIPGAKATPPPPEPPAPTRQPEPPPAPEPPPPTGPPISAGEADGRLLLAIPSERLDLDAMTTLGKRQIDLLRPSDQVTGKQRDEIAQRGCGFVAPLDYLSQVFVEGKPLDKKRFEAEARPLGGGGRMFDAHLPRFGAVRIVEVGGKRYLTSELELDPSRLLPLLEGLS